MFEKELILKKYFHPVEIFMLDYIDFFYEDLHTNVFRMADELY